MPKEYAKRDDLEKIQSQWNKLGGLQTRKDWSASVVRAATAAELATNFVIRSDFESRSKFDPKFVDSLLLWANGIDGKINRLLIPLGLSEDHTKVIKKLKEPATEINKVRNAIIHQGAFCDEDKAKKIVEKARIFIETIVKFKIPEFSLVDKVKK